MIEIILTRDGSQTLRNTELNETYHSIHGALQESQHVFIRQGLEYKLQQRLPRLAILEVGFGTGLNAWLTAQKVWGKEGLVSYVSLESFPLDHAIWSKLNYASNPKGLELFEKVHSATWDDPVLVTPNFSLHKIKSTLQQANLSSAAFDLIYFDAFAPEKQPEMWTLPSLEKVVAAMKPDAAFVTYCAKGQVKRDLKSMGLVVETLPGPPGKREMIRAIKG